jgi:hypothetical protein
MPVTIGTATTVTNSSGDFTLTGLPANPGPISAGGSVGTAQGRLDLTAPVAQLLGHNLDADSNNVMPSPLILPKIDWSSPTTFGGALAAQPLAAASAAMPGVSFQLAGTGGSMSGTLQVAGLSAALSAQHMPQGVSSSMMLYSIAGTGISSSAEITLPNTAGFKPGSVLYLIRTGGDRGVSAGLHRRAK